MDLWWQLGCIMLCLLLLVYAGIRMYLYWYRNPVGVPLLRTHPGTSLSNDENMSSVEMKPSIVTHTGIGTRGDMGNQIFQIACVVAAGARSGAQVVLPPVVGTLPISQLFDVSQLGWADVKIDRTYYEYDNYESIFIPADGQTYDIRGYRQAYKYFEDVSDQIRTLFTPRAEILDAVRAVLPESYLAIHIRRGDYIKKIHQVPLLREFKQCQLSYYQAGIRRLRRRYPHLPILVCTDSPDWVRPLLSQLDVHQKSPSTANQSPSIVEEKGSNPQSSSIDMNIMLAPTVEGISPKFTDFCVLYLASGLVISNSTYSWWAAYLRNGRRVICPTPWWDPKGFIGTGMGLNGPYLHYPEWWLLDADTGTTRRRPYATDHDLEDTNPDTLSIFRIARGLLL